MAIDSVVCQPPGGLPELLAAAYRRLLDAYGPQGWWPADSPFEMIAGAILTQSTNWGNVEKALANLRAAGCWSFAAIDALPEEQLAELVRPSGYFNAKARKLKAFAAHLRRRHGGGLDRLLAQETAALRAELLGIYGIGEETADDIIVYAAGKPSFVIDVYTRRILDRMGLRPGGGVRYRDYQALFHDNLPAEAPLFNEYHALLDHHAKLVCRKTAPRCDACCLAALCATGQAAGGGDSPGRDAAG